MDKIKLGIAPESSNAIANILRKQFNIDIKAHIISYGDMPISNIDAYLKIDGSYSYNNNIENYLKLLNIPIMGFHRMDKSLQFNILKVLDINSPRTFFLTFGSLTTMNDTTIMDLLSDLNDGDKVVIKMCQGARGIGQLLTSKKDLINLIAEGLPKKIYCKSGDEPDYQKTPVIDPNKYKLGNEGYSEHLNKIIESASDFIIQEYEEIAEEYRLLYFFNEEPIVIQREVGKNGHWQANSCITGFSKEVNHKVIDNNLLNKINNLGVYLNTPFMSTDVYKTKNGEWGIFEFQQEFGFKDLPFGKLYKRINNSVNNLYNKLK